MRASYSSLPSLAVFAALFASPAYPVPATAGDDSVLEEVVVSGYRDTPAHEADFSVSILDRETLRRASVTHFEELIPLVPNMNLSGEGARARYLQLRGIGEREQYEGAPNPSVGFFIDDIDLSGVGGVSAPFDLQRVEVLRGPQSTRFGAGALAGAVYMHSAAPPDVPLLRTELTWGDDGLLAAGAAVGGPLGESLVGRLAVYRHGSDGFARNLHLGRATNEREELTARARLRWDLPGGWRAGLSGLYADFDNGYDAFSVRNDRAMHSDHPGRDSQRTRAGAARLEGPVGEGVDLVSITSRASSDLQFAFDGDWGNPGFWQGYGDYVYDYRYRNPRQRDSLAQELRLLSRPAGRLWGGSTDWVLGLYWNRLDEANRIDSTGVYDDSGEENFCAPCRTDRQIESDYRADTLALFAGTESRLGERFSLSLGLRHEWWRARYSDRWQDINFAGPPGGSSCARMDCRPDAGLWGGHAALGFDLDSERQLYLRLARGYKAGGFNPSLAALQGVARLGPEFIGYDDETVLSVEGGIKGRWRDGAVDGELSLFAMRRDHAQLSQSSQQVEFDPNSFVFVTYNGAARVRGLEASLDWRLGPSWALHGALGLLDSRIEDTPATRAISPEAAGRALAHAPDYTLNLGARFQGAGGWFARVDLVASDGYFFDISHDQRAASQARVNLRVGRAWEEWSVAVWARNLFDETWHTRGFWFGNEPPAFASTLYTRLGAPRSFGVSLNWNRAGEDRP